MSLSCRSIRRYDYRRTRRMQWGCGCFGAITVSILMLCVGIYAFSGVLVPIIFQFVGIDRIGDVDDIFAEVAPAPTLAPIENAVVQSQAVADLGDEIGIQQLNSSTLSYTVTTGNTDTGGRVVTAQFTELGLVELCNQRDNFCTNGEGRFRNVNFDLRPNGVVVYADVDTSVLGWQRLGIVLRLDNTNARVEVIGVEYSGSVYDANSIPFDLGTTIDDIEQTGNDILREAVLSTGGNTYRLSYMIVDENTLTVVMR